MIRFKYKSKKGLGQSSTFVCVELIINLLVIPIFMDSMDTDISESESFAVYAFADEGDEGNENVLGAVASVFILFVGRLLFEIELYNFAPPFVA